MPLQWTPMFSLSAIQGTRSRTPVHRREQDRSTKSNIIGSMVESFAEFTLAQIAQIGRTRKLSGALSSCEGQISCVKVPLWAVGPPKQYCKIYLRSLI